MSPIPDSVLRATCAAGWLHAALIPTTGEALLDAAERADAGEETLELLRGWIAAPFVVADEEFAALERGDRLLAYALLSWLVQHDGRVESPEADVRHVSATVLGITGLGRRRLDLVVEELRRADPTIDLGRLADAVAVIASAATATPAPPRA